MPLPEKKSPLPQVGALSNANFQGLLMTSFALPERPRSRRAKYPKVRTGCISCKKRHVKCDEAKPSCNRCLRWSGVCSGYAPPRSKSCPAKDSSTATTKEQPQRPLLMRGSSSPAVPNYEEAASISPSIPSSEPATPPLMQPANAMGPFADPIEDPCSMEACILDATFWTDTVPRLIKENLAVRYANMAVHILILSKQPELMRESSAELGPDHYSQALTYYGLALRQMRQAIEATGGLRAAILCSMFFVIFEAINGDKEAAESHLVSGQRLLEELHQLLPPAVMGKSSGNLRKELRNLLQYISLQVRIGGVDCWKDETDALYNDYLEDYLPFDNTPIIASPALDDGLDPFLPAMWTEDLML